MTTVAPMVLADPEAALWLRTSLEQGDGLSVEVLRGGQLSSGVYVALIPSTLNVERLDFNDGGVASMRSADDALATLLARIASAKPIGLVVENDLARRRDPALANLSLPSAYFENRVLHWSQVPTGDATSAVGLLRRGASGYPTNAFLLEASALQGLANRKEVDAAWCLRAVRSLMGVITAAFDAESFVLWLRPDLAAELALTTTG